MAGISVLLVLAQIAASCHSIKLGILRDTRHGPGLQTAITEASKCLHGHSQQDTSQDIDVIWREINHTDVIQLSDNVCWLAEAGIDGLISVLDPRSQVFVSSQVNSFQIPHLLVCAPDCTCPLSQSYSRYASPSHKEKIDLITDLITHLGWGSFGFIFDEAMADREKRDVLFAVSLIETEATITLINSTSPKRVIRRKVGQLKERIIKNILVWAQSLTAQNVLSVASELKMIGPEYQWLIFDETHFQLNASDLLQGRTISNALVASRVPSFWAQCTPRPPLNNNMYSEDTVFGVLEALRRFSSMDALSKLVNTNVCFGQNRMATNRSFSYNQFPLADLKDNFFGNFTLDGYPPSRGFDLHSQTRDPGEQMRLVGKWRHGTGLTVHSKLGLFLNKFRDFRGAVVKVTAKEEKPFVIREMNGSRHQYTGMAFDVLKELSRALNFRYEVVEPKDRRYGAPNEDGTWNGLVGMVKRQEVLMAIGPFSITALRDQVIDYTKPYMDDSIGILTRKPQKSANLFQMMRPFSTEVWVGIAISVLLGGAMLTITNRLTPYGTKYPSNEGFISDEHAFFENLWVVYASVMEQGAVYIPAANSSRCILGFWWIFTILIISTYTANLAAFLTVADPSPTINTLAQLLQQEDLGVLVQDGSNLWTMFKDSNNDMYKEMWKRLQYSPVVDGLDAALPHVRTGKYAYVGDKSTLEYVAAKECHSFVVAGESFNAGTYGLVMAEDTPFKEAMDHYIMKMLEAGLIDNWRQKWWSKADDCTSKLRTSLAAGLSLDTLGGVFIVYCLCAICATLILILSLMMKSNLRCKSKDVDKTDDGEILKNNNTKVLKE